MKFPAAILVESNRPLEIVDIDFRDSLKYGQVLVSMISSGICGAQINEYKAVKGIDNFLPHLMGHEGYAEVVDVGPEVKKVKKGDKVILHWMKGNGIESEVPKYYLDSKKINAGWVTTFNKMAVISENRCTPISSELNSNELPLFGCAIPTAWGVLNNEAHLRFGDSILIVGAGGVGLITCSIAKSMGAQNITIIDLLQNKLDLAKSLGAEFTIISDQNTLLNIKNIEKKMPRKKFDVIIETTGNKKMIEMAYSIASQGGTCILVGVPNVNTPAKLHTLNLHFGMKFFGTKGGNVKPESDIPNLIYNAEKNNLKLDKFPVQNFTLNQINLAVEKLLKNEILGRIVIGF